ncbi:MAG TPA: AraC family transcriptional regulator [Gemmatimonadaceae bacterium]|nr:AraC family transcriptional regulator [Gemmatimonadaceae bacterium]
MNRSIGQFSAQTLVFQPDAVLPRHHHERASLSLTLEGSQRECVGRQHYDCVPHTVVLKAADIEHSNHVGATGTRGLFVEMPAATEAELRDAIGAPIGVGSHHDHATRHLARRIGHELRLRQAASSLLIEGLLFELLGTIARTRRAASLRKDDPRLWRAVEYLEAHYRNRITCVEVAAHAGLHPSFLAELFRRHLNVSVGEWVRNRRLDFACDALRHTTTPISSVAFQAGFADQSHLTRLFRVRFGLTPAQYRRILD